MSDPRSRRATRASRRSDRPPEEGPAPPHERFLTLGRDRAEREWLRYEGTAQRELFRQLRQRFLARHARTGGWALDLGSGPGRFTPSIGGAGTRRVALDLSRSMLEFGRAIASEAAPTPGALPDPVRGDGLAAPFADGAFGQIALVGNALGFEGRAGAKLLDEVRRLLAPGGCVTLELAPGPGERSRYLTRLPSGAVRRLFAAPPAAIVPRAAREGFVEEPERHRNASFRRWTVPELTRRGRPWGWVVREAVAVAPALGVSAARLAAVAEDRRAWDHLLEVEETLGRDPSRWARAAAVLVAVESAPSKPI